MPLAAPLILPFAELAGITIAGLGMAAASKKVSDFISDNPETSMQILTMLVPGGQGLNALFKKKASVTLEDVEDMTDEEAADLSKEDKAEIMKEVGKSKGGDKRQRMIEISEKLGLSGEGKEKQTIIDEEEERYDEGGVEDAPKPKFDYKKFFRNRNADGGAIGIEVLFEEKKDGGRIGFANGGENIIGADLKEKESVFFPKGDFENIRATSPTRTDYNIRSTEDLVRNVNPFGIVGEIGAPAAALAISRPYDMIQAGARTTTSDIDRAIQSGALTPREIADEAFGLAYERENPLSTAIERTIGAAGPLAERVGDMFSGVGNFFFAPAGAADFQGGEMLQAPTSPVRADYERAPNAAFAELLSQPGIADDDFEEMLAEATRKGQRQSFLSQVADYLPFGSKSLTGNIARGIGSMVRNSPIFYGESSRAFNALNPRGQAAVREIYGPGGIMQNYNPVSLFGRGPISAIDRRLSKMSGRTAASQQKMKDLFAAREKIMQTTLDDDSRYTGPTSSVRGQKAGVMDDDPFATGPSKTTDSDPGGSSKIVCTMMNESYGFGNFRNKIWLRHSRDLPKEYEIGYHTIFLPLVKFAKGEGKLNKVVKKTLEHIARHRTLDLKQEMKGKTHALGRVYRKILEPICLMVGKIKKAIK